MKSIDQSVNSFSMRKTRDRIKTVVTVGMLCLFCLMLIAGISSYNHANKLYDARQWVLHTYEVMQQLDSLIAAPNDAESAAYGHLLTHDKTYLFNFKGTAKQAHDAFNRALYLSRDNPIQHERLNKLKPVLDSKFDSLDRMIKLKTKPDSATLDELKKSNDLIYMEQLRHIVSEMKLEEEKLLAERLATLKLAVNEMNQRLLWYGGIALSGFVLIGYVVNYLMRRQDKEEKFQNILYSVNHSLASIGTPDTVLTKALQEVANKLDFQIAQIWIPDKDRGDLVFKRSWKQSEQFADFENASKELRFESGKGLPGRVWQSRLATLVLDVTEDNNFPRAPHARKCNLHGGVAFPLSLTGEMLGVMEFFTTRKVANLEPDVVHTLNVVALQISQYLERLKFEQALHTSERKFKAIFDETFEFIGLLSPTGIILEANKTALDFIKADKSSVIGKYFWDTPWWSHSKELQEKVEQSVHEAANGKFIRFESTHPDPDGVLLHVDFSLKPIVDDDGNIVLLIPEGRDISDKKEAEKRVSEFYSTVSHELRTPLTSIRGAFGLLEGGKAGDLSPKALRLVSMGKLESERLVRLINDILDIRKIEAGKLELKLEKLSAAQIIENTTNTLNSFAQDASIKLTSDVQEDGTLFADKDRITQVLTNLVSNAVKFSPPESEVIIKARKNGAFYRIEVQDHGPGIKDSDLKKLFQMFQQLDQSDHREKGGTGLGLAISKSIVEQHDGHIGVNSKVGEGSTFWFEIPLSKQNEVKPDHECVESSNGNKVLLVEDDDSVAMIITETLNTHHLNVHRVSTIAEAEESLARSKFSVIVLDIQLPDGNGNSLLENMDKTSTTPIVVVSASERKHYGNPLLIDWLAKPFEESKLLSAIDLAIRGRKQGPARVLIAEDDESTREIIKQYVLSLGSNIQVFEALDGLKAIELARAEEPDLIILDLGLPHTDGFEVVTVLRHEKASKTPLIVYTATDLSSEEKKKLSLGLTTHFTKSKTSEETFLSCLVSTLNGLIKKS
ncbi:MAG: response regulator [Cyanobacteria bacterium TGS_CYA1]|nr:response regulator [Cyanobacteria bacterium TGS_CYA1]